MRAVLITFGAILALLVIAVLVGPSFVDWNSQKALITKEAQKVTGRELIIDGDVSLTILPSPALSAGKVRLANIEGGSEPAMIELDGLKVRVALMPLLQGKIRVDSVSLVAPRILLEVLPDGRRNWDFAAKSSDQEPSDAAAGGGTESKAPSEGRSGRDFTVEVNSFSIQDGVLIYRDATTGDEEKIEDLNAEIVAESLEGPFALEGTATARGIETAFKMATGRVLQTGATPVNVDLSLPRASANAAFSGSLSLDPDLVGLRGRVKGEGDSLADVVAAISGGSGHDVPRFLANPFTLEANVEGDQNEIMAGDFSMSLGQTSMAGEIKALLGPPMDLSVKIGVPRIDLDRLLAEARAPSGASGAAGEANESSNEKPAGQTKTGNDAAGPTSGAGTGSPADVLPRDMTGSLRLAVDTLNYRDQIVRQVRFDFALADGLIAVNQALALLPGGADISVTGAIAGTDKGPQFDGRIEAAADNLRGVLDWLDVDVSGVAPDRLRKMSLSGALQASPAQVSLTEMDLSLDLSRIAGGVVVALRERLGFGIGLSIDSLNLDAYLPTAAAPVATSTKGQGTAQGGGETDSGGSGGGTGTAKAAAGGLLDSFDANLDLRVGRLKYRGQSAKDLRIDGTLQTGTLTLRQASVADLAGSSLGYSGTLAGLGAQPTVDGTLEMKVADPVRLAKIAGLDDPMLGRIGAFNLTSNLRGSLDDLGFNSRLAVLGGRFGLAGTAQAMASPPVFDVTLEAEHPDMVRLAKAIAGPLPIGPGLGAIDLKARLAGTPQKLRISDLSGTLGPLGLSGSLALDLRNGRTTADALNLNVALKYPNIAALARAVGGPNDLSNDLGGVDLKARVSGGGDQVRVEDLVGTLGPAGLSGSVNANLGGPSPALGDFNLNVHIRHPSLAQLSRAAGGPVLNPDLGGIDLTAHTFGNSQQVQLRDLKGKLGPVQLSGTASADLRGAKPMLVADLNTGELPINLLLAKGGSGGSGGAGGTGSGSISPRWSNERIDVSALQEVNADLKLKSKSIILDKTRLDQAVVAAVLRDGLLDLQRLTGTVHKGRLQVVGTAQAASDLRANFSVTATDVELGQLLRQTSDFDRVSGPVSLKADLQTAGASEAQLVSALSGQGQLTGSLTLKAKTEEQVGAALLGILGTKVREVRGLADTTNTLFSAFAGAPAALSGAFNINRGVLRTDDTRLNGRNAYALTKGTADLAAWQINSLTELFRQGEKSPYLTATLTGPLDSPNTRIGGEPLRRKKDTEGTTPSGPAPSTSEPSSEGGEPEKLEPKDLLKDLIKGLTD